MELKLVNDDELKNIREKHAIIIVSDGKMKLAELPTFGNVQIDCGQGKVRTIKEMTDTKF